MKNCAYCGSYGAVTREHIWPKSLIDKYDRMKTYNKQRNTFHDGEPVIKDVCETCNNIHLSKLDSYLNSSYDKYFSEIIAAGDGASLEYDYDLLLRSLLKISYNSSRAAKSVKIAKLHKRLSGYILNGGYRSGIMLRLQIVTESKSINTETGSERMFRPEMYRCSDIPYDGPLSHRFMVRMIAINSYWFYIIVPFKNEAKSKWRIFIDGFCNWKMQPGVIVEQKSNLLNIPVTKTTYMHPALLGTLLEVK